VQHTPKHTLKNHVVALTEPTLRRATEPRVKPNGRRQVPTSAGAGSDPFRVLLASGTPETTEAVSRGLQACPDCDVQVAETEEDAHRICREARPEVLLLDLLIHGSEGIALGIELGKQAPSAEVVFLVEDHNDPELRVAKDMGISRFVEVRDVEGWLAAALEPLARMARAERELQEARRRVAALDIWKIEAPAERPETTRILPLAVAEQRYREAYLRGVMARADGRRNAARIAGVPYTTFCLMLRKLGISPTGRDR
jgi:DNA-binding NarL/FixJ family response regulator